jgi:hypothetical protein
VLLDCINLSRKYDLDLYDSIFLLHFSSDYENRILYLIDDCLKKTTD